MSTLVVELLNCWLCTYISSFSSEDVVSVFVNPPLVVQEDSESSRLVGVRDREFLIRKQFPRDFAQLINQFCEFLPDAELLAGGR